MSTLPISSIVSCLKNDPLYSNTTILIEVIHELLLKKRMSILFVDEKANYTYGDSSHDSVYVPLDNESLKTRNSIINSLKCLDKNNYNEVSICIEKNIFKNISKKKVGSTYKHFLIVASLTSMIRLFVDEKEYRISHGEVPKYDYMHIDKQSFENFFEELHLPHPTYLFPDKDCTSDKIIELIKKDPWSSEVSIKSVRTKMLQMNIEVKELAHSEFGDQPLDDEKRKDSASKHSYEFYLIGDIWNVTFEDEHSTFSSRTAWGLNIINFLLSSPHKTFYLGDILAHFKPSAMHTGLEASEDQTNEVSLMVSEGKGYQLDSALGKPNDLVMEAKRKIENIEQKILIIHDRYNDNEVKNDIELKRLNHKRQKYLRLKDGFNKDRGDSLTIFYNKNKNKIDQALKRAKLFIESISKIKRFSDHVSRNINYDRVNKCYIYNPETEIQWRTIA